MKGKFKVPRWLLTLPEWERAARFYEDAEAREATSQLGRFAHMVRRPFLEPGTTAERRDATEVVDDRGSSSSPPYDRCWKIISPRATLNAAFARSCFDTTDELRQRVLFAPSYEVVRLVSETGLFQHRPDTILIARLQDHQDRGLSWTFIRETESTGGIILLIDQKPAHLVAEGRSGFFRCIYPAANYCWTGTRESSVKEKCEACRGKGARPALPGEATTWERPRCEECKGRGYHWKDPKGNE